MAEWGIWGSSYLHNEGCIGDAPCFGLGEYSKYNHTCLTPSVLLLSCKNVALFLELLLWENSRVSFSPWIKHVCLTFYSCLPVRVRAFIATAGTAVSFGLSRPACLEGTFWWLGSRRRTEFHLFSSFSKLRGREMCICAKLEENSSCMFWVKSSVQQYSYFSNLILSMKGREGEKNVSLPVLRGVMCIL